MNADAPDWTADLLAEWADCAFKVGLLVRPIMAEYYRLFDFPDRLVPFQAAPWPKFTNRPQPIVACAHSKAYRNNDRELRSSKCGALLGIFAVE